MSKRVFKLMGFLSVLTAFLLGVNLQKANASVEDNVRGFAYTDKQGYLIFNCLDDNFGGRFPFVFPFAFKVPPCTHPYGTHLDLNNNFSGDAWNEILGYVTFDSTTIPPLEDFRAKCQNGNTCTAANHCTACYNKNDGKVYGYMRVVIGGEWIRLDGPINPSTQISKSDTALPGIFTGYASSTPFGSISFNCLNDGSCATNQYEVKIGPLEIEQLLAPNWSSAEACFQPANRATLKWTRRSGVQSAYQVIISTQNNTSTGLLYSASSSASQITVTNLAYDTPYYWFLRLWDDRGEVTPWRQFDTSSGDWISDNYSRNTQRNLIDPNKTFTTYIHEFPRPVFSYTPTQIIIATTTNSFVSASSYYDSYNVLHPCSGSTCFYQWQTSDASATILSPTTASTSIDFTKATNTTVTLKVSDNDNYFCATSTTVNANYSLPLWKEVKP